MAGPWLDRPVRRRHLLKSDVRSVLVILSQVFTTKLAKVPLVQAESRNRATRGEHCRSLRDSVLPLVRTLVR